MPPKAKFTAEEIVNAALEITREKGTEALTARELGKRLGSSARPVFTVFRNMEEVQTEVYKAAKKVFGGYLKDYAEYTPSFKRAGMQIISFAMNEPKLFQLLFMRECSGVRSFEETVRQLPEMPEPMIDVIQRDYRFDVDKAWRLLEHMWVHVYGICVMCAYNVCSFSKEEISQMMGDIFCGQMMLMKSGKESSARVMPHKGKIPGFDVSDTEKIYSE